MFSPLCRSEETHVPTPAPTRLRGLRLVLSVYEELRQHAGDEFSIAELLQAAQQLIDLSRSEYVTPEEKIRTPSPNYFSQDVLNAYMTMPWRVQSVESRIQGHAEDADEISPESGAELNRLLAGADELIWDY